MIKIDKNKCVKCGLCEKECPAMAIDIDNFIVRSNCISCSHCVAICPKQAVSYNGEKVKKIKKNEITADKLLNLYKNNRSIRFFKNKEIPEGKINELIKAIKYYPSASNQRKSSITIIRNRETIDRLNDFVSNDIISFFSSLSEGPIGIFLKLAGMGKKVRFMEKYRDYFIQKQAQRRDFICFRAPVVILFHARKSAFSMAKNDCIIWAANTTNLALSMGLGSCFIGYIEMSLNRRKNRNIKKDFGIPEKNEVHAAIVTGYPDIKFINEVQRDEQPYDLI